MAGVLRRAVQGLGNTSWNLAREQQRRAVGDLPVKSNKFIEDLAYRRENIEREFEWNADSLTKFAILVGVIPYTVYHFVVKEFCYSDEIAGRPRRRFLGSD